MGEAEVKQMGLNSKMRAVKSILSFLPYLGSWAFIAGCEPRGVDKNYILIKLKRCQLLREIRGRSIGGYYVHSKT